MRLVLISTLLLAGTVFAEPPSAGWNFGNVTYAQEGGSLILNSLSDNYGISQYQTPTQSLGNNDYIPESAVKNMLALDGYTKAYDYNPSYSGLYNSTYNMPLPTSAPLTKLSFMGLAGNPNAEQDVYVLTSEYNKLSAEGQAESISTLNTGLATTNNNVTTLQTGLAATNTQVNTNTNNIAILGTNLAATDAQVNVNTNNIATVATGLGAETSRAETAETGLQGQINTTNKNVSDLQGQVNDMQRLKVMPEASVRFYDDKHLSLAAYDAYDATNGRNFAIGLKIQLKLGKSYEERLVEKQQKEIDLLKAALSRLEDR